VEGELSPFPMREVCAKTKDQLLAPTTADFASLPERNIDLQIWGV
jgi:hypothetical protein